MSLFKKRVAKNLRQKRTDSDEETTPHLIDESTFQKKDSESSRGSTPVSVKSGDNSRSSAIVSNKSLNVPLSFGDEENNDEEETFQVKKSNQSRKFEKMRQRMLAENERKKQKSNNGAVDTDRKSSPTRNLLHADSRQQQKKKADQMVLTGKDAEAIDLAEEDEAGEFRKALTSGEIPDANLIHKARKQRQQARETQDFVPLDDTQKYHKEKSRLVREDDNEGSDSGEEGGQFYSRLRNDNENERRQFESEFLSVEQGSDDDKDDEFDRWELEQIRKGVSLQQISSYQHEQLAASGYYVQSAAMYPGTINHHQYYSGATHVTDLDSAPTAVEVKDPQPMDIDIELPHDDGDVHHSTANFKGCAPLPKIGGGNVESTKSSSLNILSIRSKIKEKYDESHNLCRALTLDEEKLRQQSSENADLVEKLQENAPKLSTQFEFYQEIRSYVRDLLDCFDEKMPSIEQLEQRALNLYQNRTNFIIRRRQQDVRDQFDECSEAAFGKTQIVQYPDRMMRAAEREARKTRRRQAREKSLAGLGHHDGLSSDDEEAPSRLANFASEKEKIINDAANVFVDTIDDFCDVNSIVQRFFRWRKQDFDAYDQAFVDLCMPKLLSPLIRLQMIKWNPTDADFVNLANFEWFQTLRTTISDYNSQFAVDSSKHNDVGFLIPSVIEKVVCPQLTAFVQKVWDPTSTCQHERLASFVRNLVKEYFPNFTSTGSDNKNLQTLFDAVVKRIKLSLDEDLFTPMILENKSSGASIYSDRQFWFALKFMKNVLNWDNVLPTKIVQDLMLDGVLNRHLVLSLQCSGAADSSTLLKCKSVCNVFPSSWLKKNEPFLQFEPLFKVLCRIADEIYQLKSLDKSDSEKIKEICRLLVKLGDTNYSSRFVEKYRLR